MRFASVIPHVSLYPFQISDQTTPIIHSISGNESQFIRNDLTRHGEKQHADEDRPTSEGKVQPASSQQNDRQHESEQRVSFATPAPQ